MLPLLAPLVPLLLLAAPLPLPCVPGCTVEGEGLLGFVAPVVVLRSGETITWHGLDGAAHINYEGLTNFDEDLSCFVARYAGAVEDRATFRIADGQLRAEQDGRERACTFAVPLPAGGAIALPYQCVLHPTSMKGVLVVVP